MHHTIIRKTILTLAMLIMTSVAAVAQSSLEKLVEPLKDSDTGSSVIYSEKRDPSTKAIVESSLYVQSIDRKMAQKIIDAMKKERPQAISFQSYNGKESPTYEITFYNVSSNTITQYNLYGQKRGENWSISVETKRKAQPKTKAKTTTKRR